MRERSPLLIHCRFDVGGRADAATPLAARLLADGCYCNGFEAARRAAFSAASALHGAPADRLAARRAWEHDLFSQAQRGSRTWLPEVLDRFVGPPAGLAAADRPRYGELNLFEAPGGTAAAAALYGRSYIELAACPELRQRWVALWRGIFRPVGIYLVLLPNMNNTDIAVAARSVERLLLEHIVGPGLTFTSNIYGTSGCRGA